MTKILTHHDKKIFYSYDDYQDALFLTFAENPPLTYYEELDNGIMVRRDANTDEVVGYTVRNVSKKILESYLSESIV